MADKALKTFTNRRGVIHRLIELSSATTLTSSFKYSIDYFDGLEFKRVRDCFFKDQQSADQHFYLRQNIDGIIKRRDETYGKDDYGFYQSLKSTKFDSIYQLLKQFTIIDIEFIDYDFTVYHVDMSKIGSISLLKEFGINPVNIKRVKISEQTGDSYFGFEFKDGTGKCILSTCGMDDMEKHDIQFHFNLNFDSNLS